MGWNPIFIEEGLRLECKICACEVVTEGMAVDDHLFLACLKRLAMSPHIANDLLSGFEDKKNWRAHIIQTKLCKMVHALRITYAE